MKHLAERLADYIVKSGAIPEFITLTGVFMLLRTYDGELH